MFHTEGCDAGSPDLTTALVATNAKLDSLTTSRISQVNTPPEKPSTSQPSSMENPSAVLDPSIKEQVQIQVAQRMRASYASFLGNTFDESDGEEEEQLQVTRRSKIPSGTLRSADTTVVKQVLWPHELVFTHQGRPAVYKSMSSIAFINRYLTICPSKRIHSGIKWLFISKR